MKNYGFQLKRGLTCKYKMPTKPRQSLAETEVITANTQIGNQSY